jgi:hypothetical protein
VNAALSRHAHPCETFRAYSREECGARKGDTVAFV